jgi:hypothetical protein
VADALISYLRINEESAPYKPTASHVVFVESAYFKSIIKTSPGVTLIFSVYTWLYWAIAILIFPLSLINPSDSINALTSNVFN